MKYADKIRNEKKLRIKTILTSCLVLFVLLSLCGILNKITTSLNLNEETPLASRDAKSASASPTPTFTPTPIPTFQDLLTQTLQDVNYYHLTGVVYNAASKSVVVTYYWNAFMDDQAEINDTELMCLNAQQALWQSSLTNKFDSVKIIMQGDLIDMYGNKSVGDIGYCELDKTTAQKFNWDNLSQDSAWKVYNLTWLLPALRQNQ